MTEEAINLQGLQEAGTFLNALIKKFDKIVAPIFANIISFADRNSNLKLLIQEEPYVIRLWLEIYSSAHLCQHLFHCARSSIQEKSKGAFESQFPFSWLVFEIVEDKQSKSLGIFIQNS